MTRQEKITVQDLMGIKAGDTFEVDLPSYAAVKSAMSLAQQLKKIHPREDVERYQCKSEVSDDPKGGYIISITAIPRQL